MSNQLIIRNGILVGIKGDRSKLVDITIPNGVTRIVGWTFGACENLRSIIIPDSVVEIGDGLLRGVLISNL